MSIIRRGSRRYLVGLLALCALLLSLSLASAQLPLPPAPGEATFKPRGLSNDAGKVPASADGVDVIVTFNIGAGVRDVNYAVSIRAAQDALRTMLPRSAAVKSAFSHLPMMVVNVDAAEIDALAALPMVKSVSLDQRRYMFVSEADALTQASFVRSLGYTGAGVRVAVIDSGIDTDHPSVDLIGDLFHQRCFREENDCPNGNDVTSAEDQDGHGTHVAGIITGSGGVAPDVEFAALKVFTTSDTSDENILNALDYIVANQATLQIDIVNMSLGGGNFGQEANCNANNQPYVDAFATLNTLGIAVFVSTGNDGSHLTVSAPACVTGAIGVGSTNDDYSVFCGEDLYAGVTCYSNATATQGAGELVDILAPGCSILSEFIGGGYEELCGTSMASPMAAGIAALIKDAAPALTPSQLETLLEESGDLVVDTRTNVRYPAINAAYALGGLLVPAPTDLAITGTTGTTTQLAWDDTASEDGYRLERASNSRAFEIVGMTIADAVTTTDASLACGALEYRVRATADGLVSLPSNVVTRASVETCPNPPNNLRWEYIEPNTYQLKWNDTNLTEEGVVIERSSDGGKTFTTLTTIPYPNIVTYSDITTVACTEYAYRVRALRVDAFTSYSPPSAIVFAGCPPANDLFANAEAFTLDSDTDTVVNVRYAQRQTGDHIHTCRFSGANAGWHSVWYTFTPATNGYVTLSTAGSSYDTVMSLLTGTPGAFTQVRCNEDIDAANYNYQSEMQFVPVNAGTVYYVQVSTWDSAPIARPMTLEISFDFSLTVPKPANDDFADAEVITGNSYTDIETYPHFATKQNGIDPVVSCRFGTPGTGSNSVWYTYTPVSSGRATIDLLDSSGSFADTLLAVYTGGPGAFSEVACNEDHYGIAGIYQSYLEDVELDAGQTYYIYVARWETAVATSSGTLVLKFSYEPDEAPSLLTNGDFEGGKSAGVPDGWMRTGAGSSNDKVTCKDSGSHAHGGQCAFKFLSKGGASNLNQKLTAADLNGLGVTPSAGDKFTANIWVKGPKAKGVVILKVKYLDGTDAHKSKVAFGPNVFYAEVAVDLELTSGAVDSVVLQIKDKAPLGKFFVDDAKLTHGGAGSGRGAGVLPPPAAPDGFRGSN